MSDDTDTLDADAQPTTDDLATLVREQRKPTEEHQLLLTELEERLSEAGKFRARFDHLTSSATGGGR
ncbi:hypothetical protein [Halobaculum roseum]|uniref:Uncharacterized protein n=1 Tax=Halobaculum roseum TaxID=2175149 RepID=A0ABD5MML9_9EURY|nr:hypothetical protein [Halobaculum roseum]QZY04245.1 hypothetical protein K6T36_16165 [Halobaculum roseum]